MYIVYINTYVCVRSNKWETRIFLGTFFVNTKKTSFFFFTLESLWLIEQCDSSVVCQIIVVSIPTLDPGRGRFRVFVWWYSGMDLDPPYFWIASRVQDGSVWIFDIVELRVVRIPWGNGPSRSSGTLSLLTCSVFFVVVSLDFFPRSLCCNPSRKKTPVTIEEGVVNPPPVFRSRVTVRLVIGVSSFEVPPDSDETSKEFLYEVLLVFIGKLEGNRCVITRD